MNYKYDFREVLQDLADHNVDITRFEEKCVKMSGGGSINQHMFEFIYETIVVNNYNIDVLF